METIAVETSPSYQVRVDRGLIDQARPQLEDLVSGKKVMIVTDENVAAAGHARRLDKALSPIASQIDQLTFPPGEKEKTFANYHYLLTKLVQAHYSRSDYLIALGGGVIGDLVGFAAATYLRGIPFIQIPTTFLAAIDSSVGGKTAVDLPEGKNLVGAFYQPKRVLCDADSFKTLPSHDFQDGCGELIKYGMIRSPKLLDNLLKRQEAVNPSSPDLVQIVAHCITIKRDVIEKDEKDLGLRQLLNFGHTIGHAIEQASNFTVTHGRGVAKGMQMMLALDQQRGKNLPVSLEDFTDLLDRYQLLDSQLPDSPKDVIAAMENDKKRRGDMITLVVPESFGYCKLEKAPLKEFQEAVTRLWPNRNRLGRY